MGAQNTVVKQKENVKDLTECGICRKTVQDPRVLNCFHTFCMKCLKRYGKTKLAGDHINCPVCRKVFKIPPGGLEDVEVNHFVNKLIRVKQYTRSGSEPGEDWIKHVCDHCIFIDIKEPAIAYCEDCSENMCNNCYKKHKMARGSANHKNFTFEEKPPLDELPKSISNYCQTHPSNLIAFYCNDCKCTACSLCISVGVHKNHKCIDIKKAATELSQITDVDAEKWAYFMRENEEFIKSIDLTLEDFGGQIQTARDDIKRRYDKIKLLLEKYDWDLMQNLDLIEGKRKKELRAMKEESKQEMLMLVRIDRHWNVVKSLGSDCDVVQAAISLQKRVDEVVGQHEQHLSRDRLIKGCVDYYKVEHEAADTFNLSDGTNILGNMREIINVDQKLCPVNGIPRRNRSCSSSTTTSNNSTQLPF